MPNNHMIRDSIEDSLCVCCRLAYQSVDRGTGSQNLLTRPVSADHGREVRLAQGKGEASQHMKMGAHGGTEHCKKSVHRFSVQGAEVHRGFQKTEGHHGSRHVHDHRIAHMGQSDSLAYGGRTERLARSNTFSRNSRSTCSGSGMMFDHRVKDLGLIAAADAIVDSPRAAPRRVRLRRSHSEAR